LFTLVTAASRVLFEPERRGRFAGKTVVSPTSNNVKRICPELLPVASRFPLNLYDHKQMAKHVVVARCDLEKGAYACLLGLLVVATFNL